MVFSGVPVDRMDVCVLSLRNHGYRCLVDMIDRTAEQLHCGRNRSGCGLALTLIVLVLPPQLLGLNWVALHVSIVISRLSLLIFLFVLFSLCPTSLCGLVLRGRC